MNCIFIYLMYIFISRMVSITTWSITMILKHLFLHSLISGWQLMVSFSKSVPILLPSFFFFHSLYPNCRNFLKTWAYAKNLNWKLWGCSSLFLKIDIFIFSVDGFLDEILSLLHAQTVASHLFKMEHRCLKPIFIWRPFPNLSDVSTFTCTNLCSNLAVPVKSFRVCHYDALNYIKIDYCIGLFCDALNLWYFSLFFNYK